MSALLDDLLFRIRQHEGFKELLNAVERPALPRFRKSNKGTLEEMGAQTVFASGQLDQHDRWHVLLTGEAPQGEPTSQQE